MQSDNIFQRNLGALAVGTTTYPLDTTGADALDIAGIVTNSTGTTTITIEPSLDGGATFDSALAVPVANPAPATPTVITAFPYNKAQLKIVQATAAATSVKLSIRKIVAG